MENFFRISEHHQRIFVMLSLITLEIMNGEVTFSPSIGHTLAAVTLSNFTNLR